MVGSKHALRAIAVLTALLILGVAFIAEGSSLEGRLSFVAKGSSTGTPNQTIAAGSTYTAWSMPFSNTDREKWNMSFTWSAQGNETILLRDANTGATYWNESDFLVGQGTATTTHSFDLPPSPSHLLELRITNENSTSQVLTNSSVTYTEWRYANDSLGQALVFSGSAIIIAGVMVFLWVEGILRKPTAVTKRKLTRPA
jgi:hypothetical protein